MQQISSIFLFYRPFVLWSFIANSFLLVMGVHLIPLFLIKVCLIISLWYFTLQTKAKHKLTFYKNLGISPLKLFLSIFVIDVLLSIPFLLILKEFI